MRGRSIRFKVAVAAALLSSLIVVLFATLSAARFYHEQIDVFHDESQKNISHRRIEEARGEVEELVYAYLAALPVVAAGAAAGAWWLARRITKPLTNLAMAADQMDAGTLHERLPLPAGHDEISRLAVILNLLIERLEKSFAQASRFAADASHELRTPLAIMRGEIETAIQADPEGPQAALMVGLLEETQRLNAITDKLLLLAKADAGKLMAESEHISLSELVQDVVDDGALLSGANQIVLKNEIAPDVLIRGDGFLLRQLVFNLFENAAKYNCPNGYIRVQVERSDHRAKLTISNSGTAIPAPVQDRVFQRFFRVAQARDRESGGTGLGLSLCLEIARAHGGELQLLSSNSEATTFECSLPLSG